MKLKLINLILFIGIIVNIGLNWLVSRDFKQLNRMYFPEMVFSVPYNSFAINPNFSDGKTLQQPPENSIARGFMPMHYSANESGALKAASELDNPFLDGSPDVKLRGAYIYQDFCLPCHGPKGEGDGAISLRGYPPPPSLGSEKSTTMNDGQMFHILSYGQGNMPDYSSQISRSDRWKVITHVRELQSQLAIESDQSEENEKQMDIIQENSR